MQLLLHGATVADVAAAGGCGAAAGLAGAQLRRQIDFDHAGYLHPTVGAVAASAIEDLKG